MMIGTRIETNEVLKDVFTYTGATTFITANPIFRLIGVEINGINQIEALDYSLSGNSITISDFPASMTGSKIQIKYFAQ